MQELDFFHDVNTIEYKCVHTHYTIFIRHSRIFFDTSSAGNLFTLHSTLTEDVLLIAQLYFTNCSVLTIVPRILPFNCDV